MAKRGRPISVWTQEKLKKVAKEMEEYTQETEIPILAEFAYTHGYIREELYQHDELYYSIKNMMMKKESVLEKKGLLNQVNSTMAVFSLKQLGWKDKQEVQHSGNAAEAVSTFFKTNIEEK